MNRFDPSAFRLPTPGELFGRFQAIPSGPSSGQGPAAPAPSAKPKPLTPTVSSLAMSLPTAPASSLPTLNFVSNRLDSVKSAKPAQAPTTAALSGTTLPLPPRRTDAPGGSAFAASIMKLAGAEREAAIRAQILAGNVPDHLRRFKDIELTAKGADGQQHTATVRVLPDYLAVGSNEDYLLVPLNPMTAQQIADATGTSLPTRKLVNDIYAKAEARLAPRPKPPIPSMTSTAYLTEHSATVAAQRAQAGIADGQLIAGHKKDVVISNRLAQKPGTVAIYGWHQPNGKAIQPLSTVHEDTYADYSHGIRLIGGTVRVDGIERPIAEVLNDPALAPLLSDEGTIAKAKIKIR